jgi:hypothetical protein
LRRGCDKPAQMNVLPKTNAMAASTSGGYPTNVSATRAREPTALAAAALAS